MNPYANYPFRIFSSIIMLLAFCWLTIGTSFLSVDQQQLSNKTTSKNKADKSEKSYAPFENAPEEKTETGPTAFSGEFLKEDTEHFLHTGIQLKHNKYHYAVAFVDFFGDSVAQPPEIFFC